jgi:hypothetical protein
VGGADVGQQARAVGVGGTAGFLFGVWFEDHRCFTAGIRLEPHRIALFECYQSLSLVMFPAC